MSHVRVSVTTHGENGSLSEDATIQKRFWSFDRETEVAYARGRTWWPSHRRLCCAVIDAVIEIRASGEIRQVHLAAFQNAAECPHEFVFISGGKWLMMAARFSPLAEGSLRALATHRTWRPRFNVMCLLGYAPKRLGVELLALGLSDRNEQVARRAASACDELGGPEALALLESRLPGETRRKVRETIEFAIELMRAPIVRDGTSEKRFVRGVVFCRDVGPTKKSDA